MNPKAIIVGGSIAGLSCAHTLILAGWEVAVVEKSTSPPTGSPNGAGLALDPHSQLIISSWLPHPHLLRRATTPLSFDQNQATHPQHKATRTLARDEDFDFRAAYWPHLHSLLHSPLPPHIFFWGHLFLSFTLSPDKLSVKVNLRVSETQQTIQMEANLLVAADGCLSSIRLAFLPHLKLRYSGYCAWRGVLDFSGNEDSETIQDIRRRYPDLGKCLYFDMGFRTHSVLYEIPNKKLNWIWYINQPEPQLKGTSVTMKVGDDVINKMHQEADKIWAPEFAKLIKETGDPFVNVIYDCDPLQRIFWDNVVLVGDAAHPTTPHGVRSTNMSILDAAVLGKCLHKWGPQNLTSALEEYQSVRLPVTSKQVLHSRCLGQIKQGLPLPDTEPFDPQTAHVDYCQQLLQKNMPFFSNAHLSTH